MIPYEQYLLLIDQHLLHDDKNYLPHEVVGLHIKKDVSLIAAWRIYKGISQQQLADKLEITQPAIAQLERKNANLSPRTIQKIAQALEIRPQQLNED